MLLTQGTTLKNGEYKIKRKIGEGAMGEVFEAACNINNQRVAIKIFDPSIIANQQEAQEASERFDNEGDLLKRLNSILFPSFLDSFHEDGKKYLVMELVKGINLYDYLKQNGQMTEYQVKEIGLDLTDGLEYLHNRGIIYRDLKPQNIILTGETKIKIVDMGTAKDIKISSGDNTKIGTPGFAAPEQYCNEGVVDVRTDIYNLGTTLINLLGGKSDMFYFMGFNLPNISLDFKKFLQKAVEMKPQDRFQTVTEVRKALERVKINQPAVKKSKIKDILMLIGWRTVQALAVMSAVYLLYAVRFYLLPILIGIYSEIVANYPISILPIIVVIIFILDNLFFEDNSILR